MSESVRSRVSIRNFMQATNTIGDFVRSSAINVPGRKIVGGIWRQGSRDILVGMKLELESGINATE